MRTSYAHVALALVCLTFGAAHAAGDKCRQGASALSDAKAIAGVRGAIAEACPCAEFDASTPDKTRGRFVKCAKGVIKDAGDGSALPGGYALRKECKSEVTRIYTRAACGYAPGERVMCCEAKLASGKTNAKTRPVAKCVDSGSGQVVRNACYGSPFAPDACSGTGTNECRNEVAQQTLDIPSPAQPANTPGSPSVTVGNPKLITQFGGTGFSLNNARYTRYAKAGPAVQPDAILVLVPGFEGGAGGFKPLAENVITRAAAASFAVEVWAVDRRSNQLEDMVGLDLAEQYADPQIALDWLFGGELTLPLHPLLVSGPNRRAVFYDPHGDVPFIANWTQLVFSQDIDAVVTAARAAAKNQNVFLGGHSAGTGFTARYAATDFNLTGVGPADPGYAKLRGLVLLEGGGGSVPSTPPTADTLDRIEAKFDGGLYGAVRQPVGTCVDGITSCTSLTQASDCSGQVPVTCNVPGRCVDGTTACTIANEATACSGQVPPKCTLSTFAYSIVPGLLNARILAAGEVTALQAIVDPDGTRNIVGVDQGSAGNNAVAKVPDLAGLGLLGLGATTAYGGLGSFVDDDGLVAPLASFVATSVGATGPTVGGLVTWLDLDEGPFPPAVVPNNGPPPVVLPAGVWGQEKEVTRMDRLVETFYQGGTNFTDVYYPGSGLGVTSVTGVCTAGFCTVGNVGAACSSNTQCSQSLGLDSTPLSVGRGRRDIENLTQAANIDIPVIAFGGTNGLAPVPASFLGFAGSVGPCTKPGCDGTPRVVNPASPNPAFPTFGGQNGGYEVVMAEGFAHVDVLTADDGPDNPIPAALLDFLQRNAQ